MAGRRQFDNGQIPIERIDLRFGDPLKFLISMGQSRQWEYKDFQERPQAQQQPNPSPKNNDEAKLQEGQVIVAKLNDKLQRVDKELMDSEEVKVKLNCQVNLLKIQVAMLMKQLEERVLETSDIKLDLKQKMIVEQLNLSFRKSKLDDSRRRLGNGQSIGGISDSQNLSQTSSQQQPFQKAQNLSQSQQQQMLQQQQIKQQQIMQQQKLAAQQITQSQKSESTGRSIIQQNSNNSSSQQQVRPPQRQQIQQQRVLQ
eukprot:403361253